LGNPPEKGGKKKENLAINPGRPAQKGRKEKKKKKNLGINPGQLAGKGWETKKKPWY
jgi:hypothetical protein